MPHSGSTSNAQTKTILKFLIQIKIAIMYSGAEAGILGINLHFFVPNTTMTFDLIPGLYTYFPLTPPPSVLTRDTTTAPVPSPPLDMPHPLHLQHEWPSLNSYLWCYTAMSMKSKAVSLSWSGITIPTGCYTPTIWTAFGFFNAPHSLLPLSLFPLPEMSRSRHLLLSYFHAGFIEGVTPGREPSLLLHAILQV